jgi:hypothetical protein
MDGAGCVFFPEEGTTVTDDPRWLDLVLVYEDLTPEERAGVDAFLETRPEFRDLLSELQRIEAGPRGQIPESTGALSVREEEEAARSLASLRRKVARHSGAAENPTSEGIIEAIGRFFTQPFGKAFWGFRSAVMVGAAAVAAWMFLIPTKSPVGELTALPTTSSRGVEVDEGRNRAGDREWRTGDAFFLRCVVQHPVVPVLFHIDPAGDVTQLFPEDDEWRPFDGVVEFPLAGTEDEWRLEGEGTETFLLATRGEAPRDFAEVTRAIDEIRASGDTRVRVVERIRRVLSEHFDDVRTTDVAH